MHIAYYMLTILHLMYESFLQVFLLSYSLILALALVCPGKHLWYVTEHITSKMIHHHGANLRKLNLLIYYVLCHGTQQDLSLLTVSQVNFNNACYILSSCKSSPMQAISPSRVANVATVTCMD